jgi:hypothetical protein
MTMLCPGKMMLDPSRPLASNTDWVLTPAAAAMPLRVSPETTVCVADAVGGGGEAGAGAGAAGAEAASASTWPGKIRLD